MSSPSLIPEENLKTEPASEDVSGLRPNTEGSWTADVDSNPAVVVTLVTKPDDEPVAVGAVVIEGNAEAANVFYKPTLNADEPFEAISLDDNNEPKVCTTYILM